MSAGAALALLLLLTLGSFVVARSAERARLERSAEHGLAALGRACDRRRDELAGPRR